MNYLNKFVQLDEKEYIWYKLCCYYHAKTELYDRELTDLRSRHDPTEACIVGWTRSYSYVYANKMRKLINYIAYKLDIDDCKINKFNHYKFSAQGWIDEYIRLLSTGEMDFIDDYGSEYLNER